MDQHVRLDDETSRMVEGLVEAGRFDSAEAVVSEGVKLVRERQAVMAALLAKVDAGLADGAAGRVSPLDQAFDLLEAELDIRETGSA
jgi:antitoxin ParD1/3/4